jgi:hypothetical protein
MSSRGYVLDLGANRFEGSGDELLADEQVVQLYLGGSARIGGAEDRSESEAAGT